MASSARYKFEDFPSEIRQQLYNAPSEDICALLNTCLQYSSEWKMFICRGLDLRLFPSTPEIARAYETHRLFRRYRILAVVFMRETGISKHIWYRIFLEAYSNQLFDKEKQKKMDWWVLAGETRVPCETYSGRAIYAQVKLVFATNKDRFTSEAEQEDARRRIKRRNRLRITHIARILYVKDSVASIKRKLTFLDE